jgi:DNA repair protein RadA/Sms
MIGHCLHCGTKLLPSWSQCRQCGQWLIQGVPKKTAGIAVRRLSDETVIDRVEYLSPDEPYAICFGEDLETGESGFPKVGVHLLSGAPGSGKSTLAIGMCDVFSARCDSLYIAGEEGFAQIKQRAQRMRLKNLERIQIHTVSSAYNVFSIIQSLAPGIIVVDSIQKLAPNPEEAVRVAEWLKDYATAKRCPSLLIGTVNKDEDPSGLMRMQHVVDTVSTFLREPESAYDGEELIRVQRVTKNRFGRENVDAYFEMTARGLICLGNSDTHRWSDKGPPYLIEPQ